MEQRRPSNYYEPRGPFQGTNHNRSGKPYPGPRNQGGFNNYGKENHSQQPQHQSYSKGPSHFGTKPQASAIVPKTGGKVKVLTNQYNITLTGDICVYYYHLNVIPEMKIKDSHFAWTLVQGCKMQLDLALGMYMFSGKFTHFH